MGITATYHQVIFIVVFYFSSSKGIWVDFDSKKVKD